MTRKECLSQLVRKSSSVVEPERAKRGSDHFIYPCWKSSDVRSCEHWVPSPVVRHFQFP